MISATSTTRSTFKQDPSFRGFYSHICLIIKTYHNMYLFTFIYRIQFQNLRLILFADGFRLNTPLANISNHNRPTEPMKNNFLFDHNESVCSDLMFNSPRLNSEWHKYLLYIKTILNKLLLMLLLIKW